MNDASLFGLLLRTIRTSPYHPIDIEILAELEVYGSTKTADLAERIGLAQQSVTFRMTPLHNAGYIENIRLARKQQWQITVKGRLELRKAMAAMKDAITHHPSAVVG